MINELDPTPIFMVIGTFYIFSGLYFKVTCPVEPMKVISAYAIAMGISSAQIQASCFWIFILLMAIGATGLIDKIGHVIRKPIIRGVQLSTGILLLSQGVRLMAGTSSFQLLEQAAEPYLVIQNIGFLPIGIIFGVVLGILSLILLDNKRIPAALMIIACGLLTGLLLGKHSGWEHLSPGIYLPHLLPYGLPTSNDFTFALIILALPQIPMTIGNAVIANKDLSFQYFSEKSGRVTYRALCVSMALANLLSFLIGGIPVCHGAGGLASRYRFGARTGGSNLMIGSIFLAAALLLGPQIVSVINLLPLSVLGVLLVFAGAQLGLTILDLKNRKDLFVVILIVGITLASNLAAGFLVGIMIDIILRWKKISI